MTIPRISRISQLWYVPHPDPSLQLPANVLQWGILILPLYPTVGAITLGFAALFAWLRKYPILIHRPQNWGFAILSIFLIISAIFAWQKQDAFLGIFNLIPFFWLFAATSIIVQTPTQLRRIAQILVYISLPIGLLGFFQLFFQLQTPPIWEQIFGWSIIAGGNPSGRMSSIFIYANIFAGYTVTIFIFGLGLWIEQYQKMRRHHIQPNWDFVFLSLIVIVNFSSLILSNSRNAWLMAILACIAYALYQGWRIIVSVTVGIGTSMLLAAYAPLSIANLFRRFVPEFFWSRLNDQQFRDRPVVTMRKTQWDFVWGMMRDRPLTGWGLRNFTPLYEKAHGVWLGHPHNLYLMLAGEVGIPATLLFITILIWILIRSIQALRITKNLLPKDEIILFTYTLVFLCFILFNTFDVTLFDFRLNILFWTLIGALNGNIYYTKSLHKKSPSN